MERLVKSLKEFPDMLNLREIVVDETMTVLGGNMRLLALQKIGARTARQRSLPGLLTIRSESLSSKTILLSVSGIWMH